MEGRKVENPACELQGICQHGWKGSNSSKAALEMHLETMSERSGSGQGAAVVRCQPALGEAMVLQQCLRCMKPLD